MSKEGNELSAEAASVLEVARREYMPSESDRRRLREGIQKRVTVGAAIAETSEASTSGGKRLWRVHGTKLVALSALVVAFTAWRYAIIDAPRASTSPAERHPASPAQTERRGFAIEKGFAIEGALPPPVALRTEPTLSPELLPDAPANAKPANEQARKVAPAASSKSSTSSASSTNVPGEAAPDLETLGAEMRILREAHTALTASDLPRARKALDEHASSYPRGVLREERLALSALVLCGEGRPDEARRVAEELARESPHSSHLARLRGSCAANPAP